MKSYKSEIWTRKDQSKGAWGERMRLLGYAGSSAAPTERGVEGCMPGTTGAEMPEEYAKDKADCLLLAALVAQWREPDLVKVRSYTVVPDFTNRAQTGLGVELVHYIAGQMASKGFMKRKGTKGHDIPVVVREPPDSVYHAEALNLWKERVAEEDGFPPVKAGGSSGQEEIFSSLGNGHFYQALNCFATGMQPINGPPGKSYSYANDANLKEAITEGVPSIVLRHEVPKPVRAKIAALLNSKRDMFWTLNENGTVDVGKMEESDAYCSQFEWLSKGMDAFQVDCLVRSHLGIKNSKRIMG
eukprot:gnl/TRDRNA2_/TRDRNA2_43671_c1_seq1.p1 gnl/TRDRNA2_/TRDRNA2_43671_c1~~gnl/TRDRNA2_/TRDRNA2_43671_c1_seq1.p1  ORF type:complete len:311 (-),score=66.22 gnl/TRDRNA2_/TRDRNA2_43671_c1_seq1:104-1003(-)